MNGARTLEYYLRAFSQLKVNRANGRFSPHKPCMLLALLGLAEADNLTGNVIEFAPPLLERYARVFEVVRGETDHANPYFPFFICRAINSGTCDRVPAEMPYWL